MVNHSQLNTPVGMIIIIILTQDNTMVHLSGKLLGNKKNTSLLKKYIMFEPKLIIL